MNSFRCLFCKELIVRKIGDGTAGARFGLVEGRWLYYFKGGAAWMNANYKVTNSVASDDIASNRVGWTVGGGVEYMFLRNFSAKLEYGFLDFGNQNVTFPNVGATMGFNTQVHEVKLGLNCHWFP